MNLYNHQFNFLTQNPNKKLLVWETGTGKTRTAIEWAIGKGSTLIVCPKALKENWNREIIKWSGTHNINAWLVMSKEEFRKDAKNLVAYDSIIIDEAHYFSGMKSQMSKAMLWYIKHNQVIFVLGLTATPFMSNPWNVYRLGQIMGQTWHYWNFKQEFFNDIKMGRRVIPVMKKGIEKALAIKVQQIGNIINLDDCADVPESVFDTEYFELTKQQKTAIVKAYDVLPIVRYVREHQICGGTLKGDEYNEDKTFTSDKLDRIKELVEQNDKTIIVCRYNHEIDILKKELGNIKPVFVINGKVSDKDAVLQKARKQDKFTLIVNSACSEGWEAPEVKLMIFYSYSFSLKDYIQMVGRIQRINKLDKRTYLSLIVKGTIDEEVYKSIMRKEDFHAEIYDKQTRNSTRT